MEGNRENKIHNHKSLRISFDTLIPRELLSHKIQNFLCSPKGYKQNHAQKFPISLSVY